MTEKTIIFMVIAVLFVTIPIGTVAVEVDFVSGNVWYNHLHGDWKQLAIGMNLVSGDMVETRLNSEAILLDGDNEIYIAENSKFTISEKYVQDKQKPTFMLFLGRLRFKLGKSGASEPDILTQTVNLTIRGTEFEVGSGYDGSTIVLIEEGSVAVQGKRRELLLESGEGMEVGFGEEPTQKFEVLTRVIDWDEWLSTSQRALRGRETQLLSRILERFEEIKVEIVNYEDIREEALAKTDQYISKREQLIEEGKVEEADEMLQIAGTERRKALHSLVNIRFLALSSIGLYDMANRIYTGLEKPSKQQADQFDAIRSIYSGIDDAYIYEGDRERLEEKAEQKKGCLSLF